MKSAGLIRVIATLSILLVIGVTCSEGQFGGSQVPVPKTDQDIARQEEIEKILTTNPQLVEHALEALIKMDGAQDQGIIDIFPINLAETMGNAAHPVFLEIVSSKDKEPGLKALVLKLLVHQAYTIEGFDYENSLSSLLKIAASHECPADLKGRIQRAIAGIICSTDPAARSMRGGITKMKMQMTQNPGFIQAPKTYIPGQALPVQPAPQSERKTYSLPSTNKTDQN